MQTLINSLTYAKDDHALLFSMLPVPLSNVPFHNNTEAITRYFANGFPLHLAVHQVSPVYTPPVEYTQPHLHEDHDEINIIISDQKLVYRILLDNNEYIVKNNSCVWIPRGMRHSANVLEGAGHFITIRRDAPSEKKANTHPVISKN